MSTWLLFVVLGVGTGAVYGSIAMGQILVYRGSGVVNFAHGAMAMYPAMVFVVARDDGVLVWPVVGLPDRVEITGGVPTVAALGWGLVVAAIIGLGAHVVVFRWLRDAPALTRVIASVGMTIVLQGLAVRQFGTATLRTDPVLPADLVQIFGRPVPQDRFWLAGAAVVVGVALVVMSRRSLFGLVTRAAASNPKGAVLLGFSPDRLGAANWVLAGVIAGGFGMLMTPISGVNPFNYSLFVVPALAAALAARFRSFGVALAVGLGIGMFEGLSVHLVSRRQVPDLLAGGFDSIVPFALIVVSVAAAGRVLPGRETILERAHPRSPRPGRVSAAVVVLAVAGAALTTLGGSGVRLALLESLVVAVLLLSTVVITGFVGQVSLVQLGLAGVAAFSCARLTDGWGWPFPWGPLAAVAATTVLGSLIAIPALRIRGIQFAIVTLAAAVAIEQVLFRSPAFTGLGGLAHVDPPELGGVDLGILAAGEYPARIFGFGVLAVAVACTAIVVNLRRSATGRRFLAVRGNERAAAAVGVDVAAAKVLGASIASALAAVSGVLFAYKNVDFSQVGLEASRGLQFLALGYLGGIGSAAGALIGGALAPAGLFGELTGTQGSSELQLLISGIGLVVVAVAVPGGLAGTWGWWRRQAGRASGDGSLPSDPRPDPDPPGAPRTGADVDSLVVYEVSDRRP